MSTTQGLWIHEAHIRMAWLYLRHLPLDEVVPKVREAIRQYNASVGGTSDAYHETITRAYLVLIDQEIDREFEAATFDEFRDGHASPFDRSLSSLLEHYSQEVLHSQKARETFIEPNIAPLTSPGPLDR